MKKKKQLTIWSEGVDDLDSYKSCVDQGLVKEESLLVEYLRHCPPTAYPDGVAQALALGLKASSRHIVTRGFIDAEYGFDDDTIAKTDVLMLWGHFLHEAIPDSIVDRLAFAVYQGMGLVVLHSGHHAKLIMKLLHSPCNLTWSESPGIQETVITVRPEHPIAKGVPQVFQIPQTELYAEPFGIKPPDEVVFSSVFSTGHAFRSGVCYSLGYGKVFYFAPGHETYPIYQQPEVLCILHNAVDWCYNAENQSIRAPVDRSKSPCPELKIK